MVILRPPKAVTFLRAFLSTKTRVNSTKSRCFRRSFSTVNIVGDKQILVRDYIKSALYNPNYGYFSKRSGSVGVLDRAIKFNQLEGRGAYMKHLDKLYKQHEISWFTPVELFKKQIETVGTVQSHLARYTVECRDALDRSGWGEGNPEPCWVLMLEVLDNLPHDLVYSTNQISPWMEVWLAKLPDSMHVSEVYKPLEDPLIARCVELISKDDAVTSARRIWSKAFPKPRRAWMPTGCMQLMDVLHWALPKMSLIASDFSYLPDVKVAGDRAPLVSSKMDGRTIDHSSYLDAKGDADIFFPTDFWLLEQIDHFCSGWLNQQKESRSLKPVKRRRSITLDTASFMDEFGLPSKTRTKDGYNPLLDDFKNTKVYLSVPTHNIK